MYSSLSMFSLIFLAANIDCTDANNVSTFNSSLVEKNLTLHEESEFPDDLFTEEQRKQGAIVLHIILAVYCFITIATVCTEYFLPTIKCICDALKLSDDVAAATFMSIATSSPELFTTIIGTFLTHSDIGVGHVLGNAYYDMFFVASLGGLAASKKIELDWWPITRDCLFYLIVAIILTWIVWDGRVVTYETLILLSLYIVYFVIMFKNRAIIRCLNQRFGLKIVDSLEGDGESSGDTIQTKVEVEEEEEKPLRLDMQVIEPNVSKSDDEKANSQAGVSTLKTSGRRKIKDTNRCKNYTHKIAMLLILPITILTSFTIPDVKKQRLKKYYPLSFILCVCWIGVSTYLGTWMISVIGQTVGIPQIIMGMVFMAAGGSVVEAYGVFYKARRGECSIGLSNSMGCNTLDVTMCLALPWLIKTLLPSSGEEGIILSSHVLHVNCGLLIISVLLLYAILYMNRFKLNWKLGLCSGASYITVLAIAITVESHDWLHSIRT